MSMEVNQKSKDAIIEPKQQEDNEQQREKEEERLWSWGAGTDGQLGTARLQDEHLPQLLNLPSLSSAGLVSMLACGGAHVVALTFGTLRYTLPLSFFLSLLFFLVDFTGNSFVCAKLWVMILQVGKC